MSGIFQIPSSPWAAATINAHPRLLVNSTRIARLQSRWATPTQAIGPTSKTWATLQTAWNAETGNAAAAIPEALKYLATGTASYATNAYNACSGETYITSSGISGSSWNMRMNASGIVLDWCYPALSGAQKTQLIANCQSFATTAKGNTSGNLTANGGYDLTGPGNNCEIQNYIFNSLAIEGETLGGGGTWSDLANVQTAVQNQLMHLDECWADGAWRAYEYVLFYNWLCLLAYHGATSDGEALLLQRSQHFQNHGNMAARMFAWDQQSFVGNGVYGGYRAATGQIDVNNALVDEPWQLAVLSDVDGNPVTKWLADTQVSNIVASYQGYTGGGVPWSHAAITNNATYLAFLFYNNNLTGKPPSEAGTATCSGTMPSGTFNFRGGWNMPTDLVGNYIAGPFRQNDHDSVNAGCLTLRVGGTWLITDDSGYGGSPSTYGPNGANGAAGTSEIHGYTMRSSGIGYTPASTLSTREDRDGSGYNQSNSLPAGQTTYPLSGQLTNNFRKTFDIAKITSFTDNGNTAICVSDLSKSYPITSSATCKVAFVRGLTSDLGTVALWDQYTATNTLSHIRRNFHSTVAPLSLDGTLTVQSGSVSAGILTGTGTTVYFETGGYRCTIQCCTPLSSIDVIGGAGFEGWYDGYLASEGGSPISNGVNLPYPGNTQGSGQRETNTGNWIAGQWRSSFMTTQATNTNSELMHVITVTPAGTAAPVYTLTQAKALFQPPAPPPLPPPPPPPGVIYMPTFYLPNNDVIYH